MEMKKKPELNIERPEVDMPEELDREILTRQATLWMRANDIIGKSDIDHMILETYMVSKAIKRVEMFINKEEVVVALVVYLGRFSFLFKNRKKMLQKIENSIFPILPDSYELHIKVKLHKGVE